MRRALRLSVQGRGAVEPNPLVGCVIVKDGRIIGEGYHRRFGGPHAEVDALARCSRSPAGATVYVTLEPCCHTNKKTPPCTGALIEAGVARVMAACLDPNPQVAGEGLARLRSAGIATEAGLLEGPARQLNAAFFAGMLHRRPYVTLKWAQSADGKVAGPQGQRLQITGPASKRQVHELRGRCDAILVGIGTALADDPLLTARNVTRARPLIRCVLDSSLRLPESSQLVRTAREHALVVYCLEGADERRVRALESQGAIVAPVPAGPAGLSLPHVLGDLHGRHVTHLLVEPGPTLAASFIDRALADRLWVFQSPLRVGAETAPSAPAVPQRMRCVGRADVGEDRLAEYLDPCSGVFFAAEPSADLQLAPRA